ncbi:PAX3- and PAX7-binding protein 1 isoform X2 [Arctopsyche grandis]|uniref:PAX3- and PAX7-binding protein 1 isoform X2 n=1 Tax=Arctopsyche grandis TaxID=121162 RepID=UPI00406D8D76
MSLFRKPRRRMQVRSLAQHDDDEESPAAPPPPTISPHHQAPPAPPPAASRAAQPRHTQALLSFGDEVEDDSEVFRVKKSSYSKKLQKQIDRERRGKVSKDDTNLLNDEKPQQPRGGTASLPGHEDDAFSKNSRKNDTYNKKPRSVEGIILSGRAALVAGATGDISGSEGDESDTIDEINARFKPMFRPPGDSVRALLDRGVIPDAALIHAARKKRQQAREIGDFIPLQSSNSEQASANHISLSSINNSGKREGRLVREDGAGDASDEDPDRIDVRGVAPETSRKERMKIAREEGPGSDVDSDVEEWEAQQIRKAVTQNQIMAVQQETYYSGNYVMPSVPFPRLEMEMNPFTIATNTIGVSSFNSEHLKPLVEPGESSVTPSQLTNILHERISLLQVARTKKADEFFAMDKEMKKLQETRQTCSKKAPLLATRYEFYQKLRGYLTDLIECLDEKMPLINALEARAMTLQKRKAAFICERRRADVRDQAYEVLQTAGGVTKKDASNEERRRRCAEREGRRLRRRRAREQLTITGTLIAHRDGDSSDDEVPQTELAAYESTHDQIISDVGTLFSDTLDEFSSLASVLSHLEDWKQQEYSAYVDAYVSLCLPRLAGPFLRLKLLLWNPITDESAPDWDKMPWYRGLMLYGLKEDPNSPETEDLLASDPDICLIPNIVQKVILPKLTELIEGTWDPMSGAQSRRLASILRRAAALPGAYPSNRVFTDLAKAVLNRIRIALQHDVFIPILPKRFEGGSAFLKRQAASGVRLLNNLGTLHGAVADNTLAPLVLEALLQRYLLAAIRCSPPTYSAELCWTIAACLPRLWLEQERSKPPLQQFAVCCQEVLANLTDNVMNLKAIEQIRSTISILQTGQPPKTDHVN